MRRIGRLTPSKSLLLVCDIQEIFRPLIFSFEDVLNTSIFLTKVTSILHVPSLITEHYPERFKSTCSEILEVKNVSTPVFSKSKFSMLTEDVNDFILKNKTESIILCGIESHVCVQQTCLDLLDKGLDVHLVIDGISSMRDLDRKVSLDRMKNAGAFVSTAESLVFELLKDSKHESFKTVSLLLKEHNKKSKGSLTY